MTARTPTRRARHGTLSEDLLEVARPLLEGLDHDPTAAEARKILRIAITIWNIEVLAHRGSAPDLVASLRATLAATLPPLLPIVEQLTARKAALFPDALRFVGDWTVFMGPDGEWGFHVEARELPRRP